MTFQKRPDPIVIGARLRAEREATPYWSRGRLARLLRDAADPRERDDLAHISSLTDMIKQWENGKHVPDHRYRKLYCEVTGKTAEELFDTEPTAPRSPWHVDGLNDRFTHDDQERIVLATRSPVRIDPRVISDLSTILAAQRRTEDAIGSAPLLAPVSGQLAGIRHLAAEARGPLRPKMVD